MEKKLGRKICITKNVESGPPQRGNNQKNAEIG
jgi:hypothetical protein